MLLSIVYEDEALLVVDKPAGLVVHPAAGNWSGTLMNGLLAHHRLAAQLPRAGIVHRLDKDTSGLMVVGKTAASCQALIAQLAERSVSREYLALCHGRWPGDLSIEAPIGRDPRQRTRMAVVAEGKGGKPARTDVSLLAATGLASALHCRLHTGRTHQIRVHCRAPGSPAAGRQPVRRQTDRRPAAPGPARDAAQPDASAQRRSACNGSRRRLRTFTKPPSNSGCLRPWPRMQAVFDPRRDSPSAGVLKPGRVVMRASRPGR